MKRVFKIREGAKIAGVCNGLAEYFDIDVSLIRVLFVILALTSIGIFIYIAFMILLPKKDLYIS